MARHEPVVGSTLERGARASAGLSRQSCPRQRHRAGAGACGQPAACDCGTQSPECRAARCSGLPASCRPCRDWRCWRCSIRCCWRSRHCRCRGSALASPPSASCPRCWRWRSIRCCRCCATPSPGLQGVDAAILEAAQGVGMTQRQSLFTVELPLALPVMMAGIRTAAVWVIGTATLSTPIGQTSLGNYIFAGLQTQNWVFVLFGCLSAAVLALAVDQLLALDRERPAQPQPRSRGSRRHRHRRPCRGDAGAHHDAHANQLRHRRQDVYRAICAVGADRAAAEGRRPFRQRPRRPRLQRGFRRRSPPTTSTSMSTIPARCGPTSSIAMTSGRARKWWPS